MYPGKFFYFCNGHLRDASELFCSICAREEMIAKEIEKRKPLNSHLRAKPLNEKLKGNL